MYARNPLATISIVFALALSTPTLVNAANLTTPFKSPGGSAGGGGSITSPGDPFRPEIRPMGMRTETYSMTCGIGAGEFANGSSVIKLVNTSSKTIPKGATVVVTYPDGSTKTFTTPSEIKPGASVGIMGPAGATSESFQCSASASSQFPTAGPGPAVSDAPNGSQALPPKLTCEFEIVDGKVIVHWKNEGGSPIPAGAMITGKNAAGVGVSSYIQDPIDPGETVTTELDIDPSFFNEDCYATIKY